MPKTGFREIFLDTGGLFAALVTRDKKHTHGYSFTDCLSFVVMADHGIQEAFATDRHFNEAGFTALLAD